MFKLESLDMSIISFSSTQFFEEFPGMFLSRKLLLHNPLKQEPVIADPAPPPAYPSESNLDKNVLMLLSIIVCSVICSIVLTFLTSFILSSLRLLSSDSSASSSARPSKNEGIEKKVLKTFPVVNYSAELKFPGLDTECVICLSDFVAGERVRLLPKCSHGFHVRCIDKWLRSHSSCPKCRRCLTETCEKIVGCSSQQASSSIPSVLVEETVVIIMPLEPEGIGHSCRRQSLVGIC